MSKIIDIVFPATSCINEEIEKIKSFLVKNGFNPNIFLEEEFNLKEKPGHYFPSFCSELRFEQFKKAVKNSDSQIIWCGRGGYGSAELLPFLYNLEKPKNKKLFIGFSDLSSINTFLIEKWGWTCISAPMLSQIALNQVNEDSTKAILDLLNKKTKELKYQLVSKRSDPIFAVLTGGCLSVLAGNFGTKNQINWENKILFLEDEKESGERLDRYFNQLFTIMIEEQKFPAAIVFGSFLKDCPNSENIVIAIKKFVEKIEKSNLQIPVFEEVLGCLGHAKNMMPLILGIKTKISNLQLIQVT